MDVGSSRDRSRNSLPNKLAASATANRIVNEGKGEEKSAVSRNPLLMNSFDVSSDQQSAVPGLKRRATKIFDGAAIDASKAMKPTRTF